MTVTGLVGGAGTTTLAFALAREASAGGRPALVAEIGSRGLDSVAGATSPLDLIELGELVDRGERPNGIWATRDGARVITGNAGWRDDHGLPPGLTVALAEARRAHSLVVLDCGREPPLDLDDLVTHELWVAPASARGLDAVRRYSEAPRPKAERGRVLVVVGVNATRGLSARQVRRTVAGTCDSIVLVPHHPALITAPDEGIEELRPTAADLLTAIGGAR